MATNKFPEDKKKKLPPKREEQQKKPMPAEQEPEQEIQQEPQRPALDPMLLMQLQQAAMRRPAQPAGGVNIGQADGINGGTMMQGAEPERGFRPIETTFAPQMSKERLNKAMQTLNKYKGGKGHLESRLVEVEQWWKIRHWEWMQEKGKRDDMKTASGWLFNVIISKHADGIQSIPEANVLPREEGDKATAKQLSSIIPCILEQNKFEKVYSDVLWQKLKGGTGAYGIFWDKDKHNGLGDIALKKVNLLHLFWEPGVDDIQNSQNLFYVEAVDIDMLKQQYPQLADENLRSHAVSLRKYITEDPVDISNKTMVVDWYYHTWTNGKKTLQYCKFVNDVVLYATEDDPELSERGLYDHGLYPFVLDALFPVEGSPCGFGYIDVCKNAQEQIDILNQAMVKNAIVNAVPRYFIRSDGSVNEAEFMDLTKPLVHVTGNLGADSVVPVQATTLNQAVVGIINNKVGELKETSGNTDSSNGITQNSNQAASAIAALQEASGKTSRASTMSAYRAFCDVVTQIIELIRQFYDMPRQFRILGEMGKEEYTTFDNQAMKPQSQGFDFGIDMGYRLPVFDVKISAQTKSAYTKAAQNELALALYNQGVFNPNMTDQALMLLDMMDFDGKDEVMQKVSQNGTLMQQMAMYQQIALQLAQQYDPMMAEQLAQSIMGGAQAGGAMPSGGAPRLTGSDPGGAQGKVNKARSRANQSSQPNA